jgi:hypothetical protein
MTDRPVDTSCADVLEVASSTSSIGAKDKRNRLANAIFEVGVTAWMTSSFKGVIDIANEYCAMSYVLSVRWLVTWSRIGDQTVRNTSTGVKITPVFGLRDGMTRA